MNENPFSAGRASWIWSEEYSSSETNALFVFEKDFESRGESTEVRLSITADSRYRLWLDDRWMGDGPGRAFPNHRLYDEFNLSTCLKNGTNRLKVEVIHYGVDTFQYLRGNPGLLATVYPKDQPQNPFLVTDASWRVRRGNEYLQNVPRISCQLGFEEHYSNATILSPFKAACLMGEPDVNFRRREVPPLSRILRPFQKILHRETIRSLPQRWSIQIRNHLSPFPRGINIAGMAGVLATTFHSASAGALKLFFNGPLDCIFIDGRKIPLASDQDIQSAEIEITEGIHLLSLVICTGYDPSSNLAIGCQTDIPVTWTSPLPDAETVWASTGPLWKLAENTNCPITKDGRSIARDDLFEKWEERLRKQVLPIAQACDGTSFAKSSPTPIRCLRHKEISEADSYFHQRTNQVVASRSSMEEALLFPLTIATDTRVLLDLEDMTVGYLEIEMESFGEAEIEGLLVENIEGIGKEEGPKLQYLASGNHSYRNSFRFVSGPGASRFFSRCRRGGRYLQIVCRKSPVIIHGIGIVEATYVPKWVGSFTSSNKRLNEIYRIAQRTLLLCMEDTYTDCPTFEQVFWTGDARNEALFAAYAFGSYDLTEQGIRLVAQSLEKLPLAACQCPSGWDVIIPSFSFIWGIGVWDHYWQTGNLSFLEEIYPAVRTNLETALLFCTDHGLFSASTWNFFDWAPIDQDQKTVLHNSLFLVGALEAGEKMARVLNAHDDERIFRKKRSLLIEAINATWDKTKKSYPDALLPSGAPSDKSSQHTSFLSLLYQVVPEKDRPHALQNCLCPPAEMTQVGSPNALFFLLEAMAAEGKREEAFARMVGIWGKMLDAGAKTFWEMIHFTGTEFPTRSHCHGWSSSPLYLLPQWLFGIECLEPGWKRVRLHPRSLGLDFVRTEICTPNGMLLLEWTRTSDGSLETRFEAPAGVNVEIASQ
jgi:alpha-L-rhamnosidase